MVNFRIVASSLLAGFFMFFLLRSQFYSHQLSKTETDQTNLIMDLQEKLKKYDKLSETYGDLETITKKLKNSQTTYKEVQKCEDKFQHMKHRANSLNDQVKKLKLANYGINIEDESQIGNLGTYKKGGLNLESTVLLCVKFFSQHNILFFEF